MGDYLWYFEQFDFQFQSICKKSSALLSFISQRKFLILWKGFLDDSLSVVNKQGFGYSGFARLARQNPGYFQIIYGSCFNSSKNIPHICDDLPKPG